MEHGTLNTTYYLLVVVARKQQYHIIAVDDWKKRYKYALQINKKDHDIYIYQYMYIIIFPARAITIISCPHYFYQ